MKRTSIFGTQADRGGRRKLKDRRYFPAVAPGPEQRTGLKRRSGTDRRRSYR
ncbi:hypothetical protein [Desulfobacter curvatus]|uniref:hypothetical protein n=1 Tax=Desulfobacter curvatus TaxID=2290 RepID=UPI0012F9F040|nr:hypothetical protein [Desulfobacter curvatus]